jgi:hypothetical protein
MKQPTVQAENEYYQSIDVFEVLGETSVMQPSESPNDKCTVLLRKAIVRRKSRVIDYLVIP